MKIEILHETKNLLLIQLRGKLAIHWRTITHEIFVGSPKDEAAGIKFMERAEKYPENLKQFLGA